MSTRICINSCLSTHPSARLSVQNAFSQYLTSLRLFSFSARSMASLSFSAARSNLRILLTSRGPREWGRLSRIARRKLRSSSFSSVERVLSAAMMSRAPSALMSNRLFSFFRKASFFWSAFFRFFRLASNSARNSS